MEATFAMEEFSAWLKRPFSQDMDAAHWFYFVGLTLVFMILWRIVLEHVFEGRR